MLHTTRVDPPAPFTLADVQAAVAKLRALSLRPTPCFECGSPVLWWSTKDGFVESPPPDAVIVRAAGEDSCACGGPKP